MSIASSEEVKTKVAEDLRQRHLTQVAIANLLGVSRQTVAATFSSLDKYFTEKQAANYCNAFGYNREFLVAGLGTLINTDSPHGMVERIHYLERMLGVYQKAAYVSRITNRIVLKVGSDQCVSMLEKTKQLYDFITTLEYNRVIFPEGILNPPLDLGVLDVAENLIQRLLEEIYDYVHKEYGIEVDRDQIAEL